jgi:hypothetical protein
MSPMRILAFAAAVAGSLVAASALAGPNPDAQKIDACLKAASEKEQSGGVACIGLVADPCIEAAKGKNSDVEDSKACAARELAIWSARMATAIREIQRGAEKQMTANVTNSQTSWSASLTRLCPVFDKVDPGTALGGANYCRLQETAMRVIVLERLAVSVNPH